MLEAADAGLAVATGITIYMDSTGNVAVDCTDPAGKYKAAMYKSDLESFKVAG